MKATVSVGLRALAIAHYGSMSLLSENSTTFGMAVSLLPTYLNCAGVSVLLAVESLSHSLSSH